MATELWDDPYDDHKEEPGPPPTSDKDRALERIRNQVGLVQRLTKRFGRYPGEHDGEIFIQVAVPGPDGLTDVGLALEIGPKSCNLRAKLKLGRDQIILGLGVADSPRMNAGPIYQAALDLVAGDA
jgi:hypothetical protein